MPFAGRLFERIGARPLVTAGGLLAAVGTLPYALGFDAVPVLAVMSEAGLLLPVLAVRATA